MRERRLLRKVLVYGIVFLMVFMAFVGMPMNVSAAGEYSSYFAGGTGTESDPYQISDVDELQNMNLDLDAHYILVDDIDASDTVNWNSGAGFLPIAYDTDPSQIYFQGTPFTGTFNGNGYKITNLYINRPSTDFVGLFGWTLNNIKNVGLEDIDIIGSYYVGGLVGHNGGSSILNSYVTGSVNGYHDVGGLVGNNWGSIANSYSTGSVNSYDSVGGLVGFNYYGSILNSYSTSIVSSSIDLSYVGGLVGVNLYGSISNSYATGSVSGTGVVGGLVGGNFDDSSISKSYATGNVHGSYQIGGLVGWNYGSISNSYATGSASGTIVVSGLVGENYYGSISNCYSIGSVTGTSHIGGLVGNNNHGSTLDSYWDTQTSDQSSSAGGTGKTTAQMKQKATFVDWDFDNIWDIDEGSSYPYLRPLSSEQATQDLIPIAKAMNLPQGVENNLVKKLEDTIILLDKENLNGAIHKLGDFIDYAKAQRGKKLTEAQADLLIGYAEWIIDNIN